MKAAIYTQYGLPEVVQIKDIPKPVPGPKEVLIKVFASTINRTDCGFRSANYFISRFFSGLFKPKQQILGNEFAGMVEQIGDEVCSYQIGDRVFGYNDSRFGGHAEYLIREEEDAMTLMPENMSFAVAAAMSEGGHYALCDIRAAKIQAGSDVMVYGATGAIGSAAVQLLKHFGAKVTAVVNTKNIELIRSLGADVLIDYTIDDFAQREQRFDFIFDAVGKSSFGTCKKLLKDKGRYISTELGKNSVNIGLALIGLVSSGKKVLFPIPVARKEDIVFLKELALAGKYKPHIECEYTLDNIVQAYQYVESGQKTGNVVLRIIPEENAVIAHS